MIIKSSEYNTFVIKFFPNKNETDLLCEGNIFYNRSGVFLSFGSNNDKIVSINKNEYLINTLHRNAVPLYIRKFDKQIWISNNVFSLIINNEELKIREVELFFSSINCSKDIFSQLFEDIKLLLPSSIYSIPKYSNYIQIKWSDIAFSELTSMSKADFLQFLIEKYRCRYSGIQDVCLGISGGYDSRLELAILSELRKKIYCFHYISGTRETRLARKTAAIVGEKFHSIPINTAVEKGWEYINSKGYITRWDGYFAPGVLPSAGIVQKAEELYPQCEKLFMSTINGFKGRLYSETPIINFATKANNKYFCRKYKTFSDRYNAIVERELQTYTATLEEIYRKAIQKFTRTDVIVDSFYPFVYKSEGRVATRSTFLYENGMPRFDGSRDVREHFSSMAQIDKEGTSFLEYALQRLNPRLADLPCVSSSMDRVERTFGRIGKIGYLERVLSKFVVQKQVESIQWKNHQTLQTMKNEFPEVYSYFKEVDDPKVELISVQIANFLFKCIEEKGVRLSIG